MIKKKIKIGIIGAGGIGALFGSIFQKKGYEVFFLNKPGEIIKKKKFKIKSEFYGNFQNFLLFENKQFLKCDMFILAIKFPHLKSVSFYLKKLRKLDKPIICFMNGLSHIEILKKIFKGNLILGSAGHIVSFKKKNTIIHTSVTPPEIILSISKKNYKKKSIITNIFTNSGMHIKTSSNYKKIVWDKLIRLNSLAALTSLFNCNLGKIRSFENRYFYFTELLKESIKVAKSDGYITNYSSVIKKVNKLPNNLRTSMQRDLINSRLSEIDSITGGVFKYGKRLGLRLPYHNLLIKKIKYKYGI